MKEKRGFMDRFSNVTDLPLEPLPGMPLVELAGENRILIENHNGLAEYGCNEIQVKVSYGRLCVCGRNLCVINMTRHRVVIAGCIDNISILRGN